MSEPRTSADEARRREPLVLVVEDEPQVMRFLRATLPAHGYRVVEAATGAQALVEAQTRQPDLVLLDLGLPDLDGARGDAPDPRVERGADRRALGARPGARQGRRRSTPAPTTT